MNTARLQCNCASILGTRGHACALHALPLPDHHSGPPGLPGRGRRRRRYNRGDAWLLPGDTTTTASHLWRRRTSRWSPSQGSRRRPCPWPLARRSCSRGHPGETTSGLRRRRSPCNTLPRHSCRAGPSAPPVAAAWARNTATTASTKSEQVLRRCGGRKDSPGGFDALQARTRTPTLAAHCRCRCHAQVLRDRAVSAGGGAYGGKQVPFLIAERRCGIGKDHTVHGQRGQGANCLLLAGMRRVDRPALSGQRRCQQQLARRRGANRGNSGAAAQARRGRGN